MTMICDAKITSLENYKQFTTLLFLYDIIKLIIKSLYSIGSYLIEHNINMCDFIIVTCHYNNNYTIYLHISCTLLLMKHLNRIVLSR